MGHEQFIQWLFYGVLTFVGTYGVYTLAKLRDSIDKLNLHVATIIVKHEWHESEIKDMKKRIYKLEHTNK
ncbi:MAG: hypothetical protein KAT71_08310 [Gammaproteobacteria bacterium]|nr:hypothetical protein [Gammaproteobacteria bacterium]